MQGCQSDADFKPKLMENQWRQRANVKTPASTRYVQRVLSLQSLCSLSCLGWGFEISGVNVPT